MEDMIAWTRVAHDGVSINLPNASSMCAEERSGGRVRGGCWGAISPGTLLKQALMGEIKLNRKGKFPEMC